MIKNNYEFEILINGKPVKEYFHEGKLYIEGRKGTKFSLRFRNNTSRRVLFVPSVDGLNALTGKRATEKDTGYIVDAYSATTIDGWRTSDSEVAEFFFSAEEKSCAEKKGKGQNVGVLGCAVIRELEKPKEIIRYITEKVYVHDYCHDPFCHKCRPSTYWNMGGLNTGGGYGSTGGGTSNGFGINDTLSSANMTTSGSVTDSMQSKAMSVNFLSQELGTGFGEKKHSEVIKVEFERESYPSATFEIYYNTRKQLEGMGVPLGAKVQYVAPSAFKQSGEYCEEPEN
jgi:hypothetical protein